MTRQQSEALEAAYQRIKAARFDERNTREAHKDAKDVLAAAFDNLIRWRLPRVAAAQGRHTIVEETTYAKKCETFVLD